MLNRRLNGFHGQFEAWILSASSAQSVVESSPAQLRWRLDWWRWLARGR